MLRRPSCVLLMVFALTLAGCATKNVATAEDAVAYNMFATCSAMVPMNAKSEKIPGFKQYYTRPAFMDAYPDPERLVNGMTLLAVNYGRNKHGLDNNQAMARYKKVGLQAAKETSQDLIYIMELDLPPLDKVKLAAGYVEYKVNQCRPVYEKAWNYMK